jgi:hypothetical protein
MPEGIRGQPLRYSRFHCREMLYDYMSGRLDADRHTAVEAGLKEFPDLKAELEAMTSAAHYCAELGQIKPSESLVQGFQQIRLKSEIVSENIKYKNWPDLLRWSSEAVVISIFVAAIGWLIPWGSVQNIFKIEPSSEIVLADLKTKDKEEVVLPPLENKTKDEKPVEVKPTEALPPAAAPVVVQPVVVEPTKPEPIKPAVAAAPVAAAVPEKKKGPQGFLYRIMMNVAGIQDSAPALAAQIIGMGGEKAGQVEIGHRQSTGNYFHFSMPESNYQRLLKTLGTYGPVRIYKGPHERVMPKGTIRIILNIEDAKVKAATAAPATSTATGSTTEIDENTDSTAAPAEAAPTIESAPPADDTTSSGE